MKNTDFFQRIEEEKKTLKKTLFRENKTFIISELKATSRDFGAVAFSGILANCFIPFISVPIAVNVAIGTFLIGTVTHMHARFIRRNIIRNRLTYNRDMKELDRLRLCVGIKMMTDADRDIVFDDAERSLASRFLQLYHNRDDVTAAVGEDGTLRFRARPVLS